MMADGKPVDGSWELSIAITDREVEKTLRVKGDLHIGGVMLRLVEDLGVAADWSDHALWWPLKNAWLTRTRWTLDQYGVQADARLLFTPMHKNLRIQLPDLQILDMRVDFSSNVFSTALLISKEIGIRHSEELSLSRKLEREDLKKNRGVSATRKERLGGPHSPNNLSSNSFDGSLNHSPSRTPNTPGSTLLRTPGTPGSPFSSYNTSYNASSHSPYLYNNGTISPGSLHSLSFDGTLDSSLINSPVTPTREALLKLYKPKNYAEKARINAGWFDSSRSLMEQGVQENDLVLLRYKYFNFYDLNPKYDLARINQIYEQAKWSLLSEELDCTEEEMMMFAALQLQVQLQCNVPQPDLDVSNTQSAGDGDDIDAALTDLQASLEGSSISSPGDITHIPELSDYLRFFKPKKFTIKSYKTYFFKFKDTHLSMFRSHDEVREAPLMKVNLKGCEVTPEVNIASKKFNIKLFVPSPDGLSEVWIRAESEEQYANWMAACRLASKGKTMADSSYDSEVSSIKAFLSMQHPAQTPVISPNQLDLQPEDFVAPRFLKKLKTRQIAQRILEAHANVQEMTLLNAKMNYIKAWQALPEYGITYFIVKFKGSKKEELLGVASNRLIRMDLSNGNSLKTWRFSNMAAWSVNWEIKQVEVSFEENIAFQCMTADCKVVHEYIGGYIFISMRSADKNQSLNEELFHKLTGGWE